MRSEDSNRLGLKGRGTELPAAHLTSDGGELRSPESKSQLFEKVLLDSSLKILLGSIRLNRCSSTCYPRF